MKPQRFFAVLLLAVVSLAGCAASNLPKVGQANKTITTVIADAGAIANQAKQQYQAGQLPQTDAVRYAINDLGAGFEDARKVYTTFLQTYAEYATQQQKQIVACSPTGDANACQTITALAVVAQKNLATSQTALDASISALTTKTNAVKAISKK